jgi:hypothetical protein
LVAGLQLSCDFTATGRDDELALATLAKLRAEQRSYPGPSHVPTGEERALIDQLLSRFDGERREILRLILFDSVGGQLYATGDPHTDSVVHRIYALRAAAEAAARPAAPGAPRRVPTMLALVDRLDAPGAAALIVRRPDATPANVIVLERDRATGEQLAAAIAALQRIWQQDGVEARRPARFQVKWSAGGVNTSQDESRRAQKWIDLARQRSRIYHPGVGYAQAVGIPVALRGASGR